MIELKNIAGCFLIDATAAFLNGAGLGDGEDRNLVIPKTFKEKVNGRFEEVPYVSAQSWRRWLRNTSNEENNWKPSELKQIDKSDKGSTNKISTELNPIDYPEDDLFGYMKSGSSGEESVQRTSPFKTSILKGIKGKRAINRDEAFVHLKEGTPLPYSTKFYSSHLEGFFNLEYYRLGVFDNLASKVELHSELLKTNRENLIETQIPYTNFKRYTIENAENLRKNRAAGLLKALAVLRGGAKQSAFGSDVSPKAFIFAGLSSANPVFNDLFEGQGEKPALKIEALKQIAVDYKSRLATPIFIGFRSGYLQNEDEIQKEFSSSDFIILSPIQAIEEFIHTYLKQ